MNGEQDILERLSRIEEKENRRMVYARIQLALVSFLVIGLAVIACVILPKARALYVQAGEAISQVEQVTEETEQIMTKIDWEKFKELDVEGLNTAIANLNKAVESVQNAVEPIRDFFSRFQLGMSNS